MWALDWRGSWSGREAPCSPGECTKFMVPANGQTLSTNVQEPKVYPYRILVSGGHAPHLGPVERVMAWSPWRLCE